MAGAAAATPGRPAQLPVFALTHAGTQKKRSTIRQGSVRSLGTTQLFAPLPRVQTPWYGYSIESIPKGIAKVARQAVGGGEFLVGPARSLFHHSRIIQRPSIINHPGCRTLLAPLARPHCSPSAGLVVGPTQTDSRPVHTLW